MRRLWRRLLRLQSQSRIRLPRRALAPEDLRKGDRLQIGARVFRVRGSLLLVSGPLAFSLEELDGGPALEMGKRRPVRLLVPLGRPGPWTLILGGSRVELPVDCVVRFPSGES
jgi:hypothetical protein